MAQPEWGIKRICLQCGTRFYDMRRNPIVCPKCESQFDPEAITRKKRGRPPVEKNITPSVDDLTADIDLSLDQDVDINDDEDTLMEDTSDFGGDDEVVGVERKSDED